MACRWSQLLVLTLYFFTGATLPAKANAQPDTLALEHINSKAGLPQNSVRAIVVDHDGFVWVGTEKGLARFDGTSFVDFSELIPEIPEDVSLGLQLDSQNRIWINWYTHSLRILSANRRNVIVINPADGFPDDLLNRGDARIIEQKNGNMTLSSQENSFDQG